MTIQSPNDFLDPGQDTPEPRYVYISTGDDSEWLFLWDAVTGEQMSTRPEKDRHNLIELATSEGWEVVDGIRLSEDYTDEELCPDDDPGFDPMFLL